MKELYILEAILSEQGGGWVNRDAGDNDDDDDDDGERKRNLSFLLNQLRDCHHVT